MILTFWDLLHQARDMKAKGEDKQVIGAYLEGMIEGAKYWITPCKRPYCGGQVYEDGDRFICSFCGREYDKEGNLIEHPIGWDKATFLGGRK